MTKLRPSYWSTPNYLATRIYSHLSNDLIAADLADNYRPIFNFELEVSIVVNISPS